MSKRTAPQMTEFTFPDTGISVKVRKISPFLAADLAEAFPAPKPPEQEVDYGGEKGRVMEPNLSDPNYQYALRAYQQEITMKLQRVMIQRAIKPVDEDWEEDVAEYRAYIQESTGKPLSEESDLLVYVLRVCVGSQEDLQDLINVITRRSQPTPEGVQAAKNSFRG